MQEYLHNSRLSRMIDGIGFHFLALFSSFAWFILLWGFRLPALTAGAALYGIILSLRRKILDDHLVRKEKQLRAAIGGEMALERLLLSQPEIAHFETAMLLSMRHPLVLLRTGEEGTLCDMRGQKLLVSFLQKSSSASVSADDVLHLQRKARLNHASRGLLCAPCSISQEAKQQALSDPPVSFFSRGRLIALLGRVSPATDDQLVSLGRRKRKLSSFKLSRLALDRRRARRYACYGILLLCMYQFTHLFSYAAAGLACVFLAAACRCVQAKENLFMD